MKSIHELNTHTGEPTLEGKAGRAVLDVVDLGMDVVRRDQEGRPYIISLESARAMLTPEKLTNHLTGLERKRRVALGELEQIDRDIALAQRVHEKLYGENPQNSSSDTIK